jgi:hypothetical protein
MDLLSLAGLTARVLDLIRSGADAAAQACEALALGRLYGRAGREGCAMSALERAVALATGAPGRAVAVDALRALAAAFRRARRHEDAARCWSRLLHVGCPSHVRREACEALAIHHEHRVHDLTAAKGFALRSLEGPPRERWTSAVRHRLARIERKEKTLPMWPLE